jgi:hypothetical protein
LEEDFLLVLLRELELFLDELELFDELDFFLDAPFLGIFAPDSRASLNAIAIACLRLLTFAFPPDFS